MAWTLLASKPGEIDAYAHVECAEPAPALEVQLKVYADYKGTWYVLGEPGGKGKGGGSRYDEFWENTSPEHEYNYEAKFKCPWTGEYYYLWFWARQLGSRKETQWSASGWERRVGKCTVPNQSAVGQIGQGAEES